jgi:hypothetical protein
VTSAHTRKATVEHLLLPNRYIPEAKSCCSEQTMLAGSGKTGEPKVHFLVRSPESIAHCVLATLMVPRFARGSSLDLAA